MIVKTVSLDDPVQYQKSNPFMDYNHIEIVSVSPQCSQVKMEVSPNSLNLNGSVHGGLLYTLADCVAGVTARADGRGYVTQSAHINFIRNITGGTVLATGTAVKRGRRMTIIHVAVTDQQGALLADAVVDMFAAE
jgi:acyl-CoA thioesterase